VTKPAAITCIIGPTASGKTALAMAIAMKTSAQILCVDSMTVYRFMNIGTAKPTLEDRHAVVHHLLDVIDPTQPFTAAKFVELADTVILNAQRSSTPLVCVGGTPMYFKSLFEGLFEGPGADVEVRQRLSAEPGEVLHARLTQVDPDAASRIHANDMRRLIRALEVFELTGKPITQHQNEWGNEPRHHARWIGLTWDKESLNRRINARVKQMMAAGWIDEVRDLLSRFDSLGLTAAGATGYTELVDHLHGKCTLEDAFEQTKIKSRQLASRQSKWFRRFPGVTWLPGDQSVQAMLDSLVTDPHHHVPRVLP